MELTKEQRQKIAEEVLGSCMGGWELTDLGISFGMPERIDTDLTVAMMCEEEGVWNCQICNWWCEESEMHNDVCNDCYQGDDDE
jgi:hypothetical protein